MLLIDFIIVVTGLVSLFTLGICFFMYKDYLTNKLLVNQSHQTISALTLKLYQQEVVLSKMAGAFNEFTNLVGSLVDKLDDQSFPMSGNNPILFRTVDGKHTSTSLEEFLRKVQESGDAYLSDAEVDQLRKLFGPVDDLEDDDTEPKFGL
jgi:hypothetical protein